MATMESILSAALCGIVFSLLAGQPLTILGSTGPVLIFEKIIYTLAKLADFDFMSGRLWIGLWITAMLLLAVAFDLSFLIRYITRFTEESFSCLIALIFIVEAFKQLSEVAAEYPVVRDPHAMYAQYAATPLQCACVEKFDASVFLNATSLNDTRMNELLSNMSAFPDASVKQVKLKLLSTVVPSALQQLANATRNLSFSPSSHGNVSAAHFNEIELEKCTVEKQCVLFGADCNDPDYVPDVFFFSSLLFVGTFVISLGLKELKTSRFFNARVCALQCIRVMYSLCNVHIHVMLCYAFGRGESMYVCCHKPAFYSTASEWLVVSDPCRVVGLRRTLCS
jgi:hypothetical protein